MRVPEWKTYTGVCVACLRVMPLRWLDGEWRHVGGRPDRYERYCRAGYGHRAGELTGEASASFTARAFGATGIVIGLRQSDER